MQDPTKIAKYKQRPMHLQGDIGAPAELVWRILANWGGLLTWFNAGHDRSIRSSASTCRPGRPNWIDPEPAAVLLMSPGEPAWFPRNSTAW